MLIDNDPEAVGQFVIGLVRTALLLPPGTRVMVLVDDPQDPVPGPTGLFTEVPLAPGMALLTQSAASLSAVNAELTAAINNAKQRASHG